MQHFLKGMSTAFFFALILSLSSLPLLAQMQFTGVRGNVEDETGARVTQVEITATEEATALKRTTISNELGIYELGGLPPGTYTISAELAGFKTYSNSRNHHLRGASPARRHRAGSGGHRRHHHGGGDGGRHRDRQIQRDLHHANVKEVEAFRIAASLIYKVGDNPGSRKSQPGPRSLLQQHQRTARRCGHQCIRHLPGASGTGQGNQPGFTERTGRIQDRHHGPRGWQKRHQSVSRRNLLSSEPFAKFAVEHDILLANMMFRS